MHIISNHRKLIDLMNVISTLGVLYLPTQTHTHTHTFYSQYIFKLSVYVGNVQMSLVS